MTRLSPDWGKGVVVGRYGPALHADVFGEGLQRGKVLIDRAQAGAHRVHRYVGGAGRGPLGEFVGGLLSATAPGDAAFHPDRGRVPAPPNPRPPPAAARSVH